MNLTFEKALEHVDEKLHCVVDKGDHWVITYHHMQPETFRDSEGNICPIRTEFRGICFDKFGKCIRRPFHKFFNMGELNENPIDWDLSFNVMEKIDGSLVAPYLVGDRLVWGTESGETDMSKEIEEVVNGLEYGEALTRYVIDLLYLSLTPLFEYTSPSNRIVTHYEEPAMTLLAVRSINTGEYLPYDAFSPIQFSGIPVIENTMVDGLTDAFFNEISSRENSEGVVVQQANNFVKIKSLWYVQLHKNKELIETEKNVVELILSDNVDDVLPLLQEDQKEKLLKFVSDFWNAIDLAARVYHEYSQVLFSKFGSKKEFGLFLKEVSYIPKLSQQMFFRYFDNQDVLDENKVREEFIAGLEKSLTSNAKYEDFKKQNLLLDDWSL